MLYAGLVHFGYKRRPQMHKRLAFPTLTDSNGKILTGIADTVDALEFRFAADEGGAPVSVT
eukprot:9856257-Prorocentrum_lima.AAC.1